MNRKSNSLKLYFFYCSNSLDIHEFTGCFPAEQGDEHKFISLPCSGKVNILYLVKAFETGADGIMLIMCGKNECRFLQGNLRAPKRAEEVNLLLEEIGMGNGRIAVLPLDDKEVGHIVSKAAEFRDRIRNISLQPSAMMNKNAAVNASRTV